MNSYWSALIQGIVEGITEFLPISSTAHIILSQNLLGIDRKDEFWRMFTVFIQLGAILSVVTFFWKRLLSFVRSFPSGSKSTDSAPRPWWKHPLSMVMISFVVTAIPCFLADKLIDDLVNEQTELLIIGIALIVGGLAMSLIDKYCSQRAKTDSVETMTLTQAIVIGLCKSLQLHFPVRAARWQRSQGAN